MIVERSMHPQYLSNSYLVAEGHGVGAAGSLTVADEPAGPAGRGRSAASESERRPTRAAFFVDAGGPMSPLIDAAERLHVHPTHVLLTHHHHDHVSEVGELRKRWPDLEVLIDPAEQPLLAGDLQSGALEAGSTLSFGSLEVRALHTPGHTGGMLSFLVTERDGAAPGSRREAGAVFTGDTLFKGSVGGVRAPGHTTYQDLKDSIMGTLMELPGDTVIYPGHADQTSVAREWEQNAFIRIWRGLEREGSKPVRALGERATLILLADDYDGGKKAWVRWPDGSDDIVPGSRVETAG